MPRGLFALLLCLGVTGCANLSPSPSANSEHSIPKSKAETGIKLARIQERQGNLRQALKMYEDMHQTNPKNAVICHRLMVVHTRLDQAEKADEFFQKAQRLHPDNPELFADYGYACYLRGDLPTAETWLKKAHTLRPNEERFTGNLALVVGAQGRVQESLTYFRQYLDDAEAHANLGFVLTQSGDFDAARESYTKALGLNPKLKSAQHALLQLAEHGQARKARQAHQRAAAPTPPQAADSNTDWQSTGTARIRS